MTEDRPLPDGSTLTVEATQPTFPPSPREPSVIVFRNNMLAPEEDRLKRLNELLTGFLNAQIDEGLTRERFEAVSRTGVQPEWIFDQE